MNLSKIPHFASLAKALVSLYGNDLKIVQSYKLSGGDINKSYGFTLSNDVDVFMKANSKENLSFFQAESLNLAAIKSTNTIKTPELLCTGTDDGEEVGYSFLLLKYINESDKNEEFWCNLAKDLAKMHKSDCSCFVQNGNFGFLQNNFIGFTEQINTPTKNWVDFFRDYRLKPQFEKAKGYFSKTELNEIDNFLANLEKILIEPEKPSLLHGDLWNGNIMCGEKSQAILIDPACYVGHFEADIAMTELFGGFVPSFYETYKKENPLKDGYAKRRDVYNLYHILNHLNMFGTAYLSPVKKIISAY